MLKILITRLKNRGVYYCLYYFLAFKSSGGALSSCGTWFPLPPFFRTLVPLRICRTPFWCSSRLWDRRIVASLDALPSCNTNVGEKGGGAMLTRDKPWSWPGHSGKSICESTSLLLLHMKAAGHSSGGKLPQNSYICCRKKGELRLGRNCFLTTVRLKSGQHALLVKQGATVYSHNLGPNLLLALVSGCTALPRRHTWCGWLEGKSKQTAETKAWLLQLPAGSHTKLGPSSLTPDRPASRSRSWDRHAAFVPQGRGSDEADQFWPGFLSPVRAHVTYVRKTTVF